MKRKDDIRETFDLDLSDVSHDSACVEFLVSYKCNRGAIDFFRLMVWEEGSTSDFSKLRKLGSSLNNREVPKFQTDITDGQCEYYTLHNLEAAFAYRIQVIAYQRDLLRNFDPTLDIESRYIKIPSEVRFFNTASRPIDDFIEAELTIARETRR